MFCTHCGARIADAAAFCQVCGAATAPAQPAAPQPAPAQPTAQPVYSAAPMYSYPVYVMPAAPAAAPTAAHAAAPVSAAAGIPAYRQNPAPQNAWQQPAPQTVWQQPTPAAQAPDAEPVCEPQPEDTAAPLSVWQTIVSLLALFCLPIGNIIFACVWAFRLNEHPQRRTLARAALPFIAVGLVLLFTLLLIVKLNLNTISISIR